MIPPLPSPVGRPARPLRHRRARWRAGRLVALGCAVALVAAACTSPGTDRDHAGGATADTTHDTATAGPDPSTAEAASDPEPAPLAWSRCRRGLECATLTVPVDYARPQGPTIDLAVTRRPAANQQARIGALVVNPGGPGASGVELVQDGYGTDDGLNNRFDIVSWDPRGVGQSAKLACDQAAPAFLALDSSPDTPEEQAALDTAAQGLADDCGQHAGPLLDHMDTATTVRDLEQLRRAMGGDKLTFVGYSYGTFIGLGYAERYPTELRALVLDGVVQPDQDLEQALTDQTRAFDSTIAATFAACDADRSCPAHDVGALYDRVAAKLERQRIPDGQGGTIGPSELAAAVLLSAYDPSSADEMLRGLALADRGDGSGLQPLVKDYDDSTFDSYAGYVGVVCVDSPHPEGAAAYQAFAQRLAAISPRFGAAVANEILPCAYWPTAVQGTPHRVVAPDSPTILVVGNTGDPVTPYPASQSVAASLAHAVLLTLDGGHGHTSGGRSACIDDAVRSYLEQLVAPAAGTRCRPDS